MDTTTVPIEDLQDGSRLQLLAEADVVIAVDAVTRDEDVVFQRAPGGSAHPVEAESGRTVIRVELDMESDDVDWLVEAIDGGPVSPDTAYGDDEGEEELEA
jgi:hypothetical protein